MIRSLSKAAIDRVLRIDAGEVSFAKRGFEPSGQQAHLEAIGTSFLFGYHLALHDDSVLSHGDVLNEPVPMYRGFAFEGAAMALAIRDSLSLKRGNRWERFLCDAGASHCYVVHVGLGWVFARIPWYRGHPEKYMQRYDPLLKWLILDGFGFHEGYFNSRKWLAEPDRRPPLSDYGKRVFDQGLGRSIWFVKGASVPRIAATIDSMHLSRKADLWSGIGLAAAYAGDASEGEIEALVEACGDFRDHIAQGVTFGAEARELAGIRAEHTERTCRIVCGMTASDAAEITRMVRPIGTGKLSDYESWRSNIRECLRSHLSIGTAR